MELDYFKEKSLRPMLLSTGAPFDNADYIYELKFDGIRCVAYLEDLNVTLISRQGNDLTAKFPELAGIYKCFNDLKGGCILDGEIVAFNEQNKPDLYELLKRRKSGAASFVCFDILYLNGENLTKLPLLKRKEILSQNICEGHNLAVIRFIEKEGKAFFNLVKENGLEGIVAKKKGSLYYEGKRTKDWIKIKTATSF